MSEVWFQVVGTVAMMGGLVAGCDQKSPADSGARASGLRPGFSGQESEAVRVDLRGDKSEAVAATLDLAHAPDLERYTGAIITVRGVIQNEKDAARIRLERAWIRFPDSCRPMTGEALSEITGRLRLKRKAGYYKSVNNDLPAGAPPAQDFGSGWQPDEFELTP